MAGLWQLFERRGVNDVARVVGGGLVILVFAVSTLPGAFSIFLWLWNVLWANPLLEFENYVLNTLVQSLRSVPADILSMAAAALPIAARRVCYTGKGGSRFTVVGLVCLALAMVSAFLNFAGLLAVDPGSPSFQANTAEEVKLQALRGWTEKCTYFAFLYTLVFLQLKPKD